MKALVTLAAVGMLFSVAAHAESKDVKASIDGTEKVVKSYTFSADQIKTAADAACKGVSTDTETYVWDGKSEGCKSETETSPQECTFTCAPQAPGKAARRR